MLGRADGPAEPGGLVRRLGLGDAVVLGLGSMIGAGVFSVFGPAAAAAGRWLVLGLLLAALVAFCNAMASAQLAAANPTSGGAYAHGRRWLGPGWGFAAGWGFVVGKTASCAAMALTFATYALPGPWWAQRGLAVLAVLALAALNYRGITRTAALTRVLVCLSLAALAVIVIGMHLGPGAEAAGGVDTSAYGVLQSAGLLFFAFAGYARVATLGEEVVEPQKTIPRAITIALGITVVIYLVVGVSALAAVGAERLAGSSAPLATATAGVAGLDVVVRVGAAVASLGALLALVAGVGRTTMAMARERDLPPWLAAVHPRHRVPHHAEVAVAVVVSALVLVADLRQVIGFSSFGVLVYYAIANLAALRQPEDERRWPRALFVLGATACAVLVVTLPVGAVLTGVGVYAVGFAVRRFAGTGRRPRRTPS
ncbi:APC family permease [Actinokineospora spheciospongiae]|uniref:APC family permease n=1 Tax=Actinokineospora spheciospongiae TaxID=909613 RepID=UPI0005526292